MKDFGQTDGNSIHNNKIIQSLTAQLLEGKDAMKKGTKETTSHAYKSMTAPSYTTRGHAYDSCVSRNVNTPFEKILFERIDIVNYYFNF